MNEMPRIAVIPAYEPGKELPALLEELTKKGFFCIVVDDGSGPACHGVFVRAAEDALVLTHAQNRGKGCALKTAFSYIKEHFPKESTVVTLDADGQHTAKDACAVCESSLAHPDALILGSRSFTGRVPLRSRFGNTATRIVFFLSTGLRVSDTQTGLRAFRATLLDQMLLTPGERYEYEMNVLLSAAEQKLPIHEVKIETIYTEKNKSSHFRTGVDSFRIYREILRYSGSSLLSFLVDYGLYSLCGALGAGLILSNLLARTVSSCLNFTLNRRFVFHSCNALLRSALQYFLLAACILFLNTLVLRLLTAAGMNRYPAKLLTEAVFFSLSFLVQHKLIFKKGAAAS